MFAGKKSAQIREILISESAWEEMTCLFAPSLAEMGVKDDIDGKIMAVAKATCAEGETIHNMPFPVTPESVHAAILTADLLGQQWLAR